MKNNTIKLNESTLRKIVAESVKKVLKEDDDYGDESYRNNNLIDDLHNIRTYVNKCLEISEGEQFYEELDNFKWFAKQLYDVTKQFIEDYTNQLL